MSPLPLPLLGALRGGPAAPLLRLLLHNDSLMDVSARRQLYTEVFSLVGVLAGANLRGVWGGWGGGACVFECGDEGGHFSARRQL